MATVAGGMVLDNAVLFTFGKEPRSFPSARRNPSRCSALALAIPVVGSVLLTLLLRYTRRGKALLWRDTDAARPDGHQCHPHHRRHLRVVDGACGSPVRYCAAMGTLFGISSGDGRGLSAPGVMIAPRRRDGGACDGAAPLRLHPDRDVHRRHSGARLDAERPVRPRAGEEGVTMVLDRAATVAAIVLVTLAGLYVAVFSEGYARHSSSRWLRWWFGVGLNFLVGLAGQVSIGHIGFYAIGAYAVAVLTLRGVNFWAP